MNVYKEPISDRLKIKQELIYRQEEKQMIQKKNKYGKNNKIT